jgi:hypothetical protein
MKLILLAYALLGLAMIVDLVRRHFRYGTREERKVLEEKLHKDMEYLRSGPFTNVIPNTQNADAQQNNNTTPDLN